MREVRRTHAFPSPAAPAATRTPPPQYAFVRNVCCTARPPDGRWLPGRRTPAECLRHVFTIVKTVREAKRCAVPQQAYASVKCYQDGGAWR